MFGNYFFECGLLIWAQRSTDTHLACVQKSFYLRSGQSADLPNRLVGFMNYGFNLFVLALIKVKFFGQFFYQNFFTSTGATFNCGLKTRL